MSADKQKLQQPFLSNLAALTGGDTHFRFSFMATSLVEPVTITSSVARVPHMPQHLSDVYESFPDFFKEVTATASGSGVHGASWCRVEQTVWWGGDYSLRLSSCVQGTYDELVLRARKAPSPKHNA